MKIRAKWNRQDIAQAIDESRKRFYRENPLHAPLKLSIKKCSLRGADIDFSVVCDDDLAACYAHELDRQVLMDDPGYFLRRKEPKEKSMLPDLLDYPPFSLGGESVSQVRALYRQLKQHTQAAILFPNHPRTGLKLSKCVQFAIAFERIPSKKALVDWWYKFGQHGVGNWLKNELQRFESIRPPAQGSRENAPSDQRVRLFNLACYRLAAARCHADRAKEILVGLMASRRPQPFWNLAITLNSDSSTYGRRIRAAANDIRRNWLTLGNKNPRIVKSVPRRTRMSK